MRSLNKNARGSVKLSSLIYSWRSEVLPGRAVRHPVRMTFSLVENGDGRTGNQGAWALPVIAVRIKMQASSCLVKWMWAKVSKTRIRTELASLMRVNTCMVNRNIDYKHVLYKTHILYSTCLLQISSPSVWTIYWPLLSGQSFQCTSGYRVFPTMN